MARKKSFSIHGDYYKQLAKLSPEQRGDILYRLIDWASEGEAVNQTILLDPVCEMLFELMMEQMERISFANSVNGAKGGRGNKSEKSEESQKSEKSEPKKMKRKKPSVSDTVSDTEKEKDIMPGASRSDTIHAIVEHLNLKLNAKYKPNSKSTTKHIIARLNEGHTLDDFIMVIDKKHREWGKNPEMAQYLRPQTLFGAKFESYLNQPWTDGKPRGPTMFNDFPQNNYDFEALERDLRSN